MAETQEAQDDKRQPAPGGNGNEPVPDDVETLKAALAEERRKHSTLLNEVKRVKADRQELSTKLKTWNQLENEGYEPEQIRQILKGQEQQDLDKARSQGEIDKLLENQRKRHEKEIQGERDKYEKMYSVNQKLFVHDVLNRALDKVGIEPKLKRGAFNLHLPKIKVIEDPESDYGMTTVVVVGDNHMDVDSYLKNWAENDDEAGAYLKASMASGGGAAAGTAGGRLRMNLYRSQMSAAEKSKYIDTHGKIVYDKLPWAPTP